MPSAEKDVGGHPFHIGTHAVQEALREQLAAAWRDGHRFCRCGDSDMRHANPYENEPRPSEIEVAAWYYVAPRHPACSGLPTPPEAGDPQ